MNGSWVRAAKAALIFVFALFADAVFTPAHVGNPQQITRMALALSLSEGRVDIDRFADHTVDIATFEGHHYADKPPGQSILALPSIWATRAVVGAADPMRPGIFGLYLTAAILSTNGLFGAFASALLYLLARRLGAGDRGAVFAAMILAIGTPFLGWSTVLFGHVLSGSLLLVALALACWPRAAPPTAWRGLAVGLVLGVLLLVDFTALPAAALVALLHLYGARRAGGLAMRALAMLVGAIPGVATLLIYNALAFHSPFRLGYSEVVGFEGMRSGLFGLSLPSLGVLAQITLGLYRGLLPLSPVLILVPFGLARMPRANRDVAIVISGTIIASLLINSSYFYWDGGSSTGPRHLVSMLPLACLPLAFLQPRMFAARAGIAVLAVASVLISGICASTEILADSRIAAPFFDDILPRFLTPEGWSYALPLLVSWLGFAALLLWRDRSVAQRDELAARPLDPSGEV